MKITMHRFDAIDLSRGLFLVLVTWVHVFFFIGGKALGEIYWASPVPSGGSMLNYILWVISEQLAPTGFFLLMGMSLVFLSSRRTAQMTRWGAKEHFIYLAKRGLAIILLGFLISPAWLIGPDQILFVPGYSGGHSVYILLGIFFQLGLCMIIGGAIHPKTSNAVLWLAMVVIVSSIYAFTPGTQDIDTLFNPFLVAIFIPGQSTIVKSTFTAIPWMTFVLLGILLGKAYLADRNRTLAYMLISAPFLIIAFFVIRIYFPILNRVPYDHESLRSLMYFCKYPPFAGCLLLSTGFVFIIIVLLHKIPLPSALRQFLLIFGSHSLPIYAVHLLLFAIIGFTISKLVGSYTPGTPMYPIWFSGLLLLYFFGKAYAKLKTRYRDSFLKYF